MLPTPYRLRHVDVQDDLECLFDDCVILRQDGTIVTRRTSQGINQFKHAETNSLQKQRIVSIECFQTTSETLGIGELESSPIGAPSSTA
jgi:hypothetical protein